jgi:plasmid stabilization system protein ParE
VEDLRQIVRLIAFDAPVAAAGPADRILSRLERASALPFSHRAVPEKAEECLREAILQPYRIIYQVDGGREAIHVLRMRHAARGNPDLR